MGEASVQSDDNVHTAFFYGTLMVPEVFFTVCYGTQSPPEAIIKQHSFHPAILHGYIRKRVIGADYPGMVADEDASVFGMYTTGLTRANLARLDYFEGAQYERRTARVKLLDKVGNVKGEGNVEGVEKEADTYVFLDPTELEENEWDLEHFKREKLRKWTRAGYVFEDCDPQNPARDATSSVTV